MQRKSDPMTIDITKGRVIAKASTEYDGRPRWTVLTVFLMPDGTFVAQSEGMSRMKGERTKTRRLASKDLSRALALFEESDLGIIARETAQEWLETAKPVQKLDTTVWTDARALEAIYGPDVKGGRGRGDKGYAGLVAADFNVGESTVRAALANGTPIKVPLTAVMPFLDLDRLAIWRDLANAD